MLICFFFTSLFTNINYMDTKDMRFYTILLIVLAVTIGILCCTVDHYIKKSAEIPESALYYYTLGSELENYILDVVDETDIFDDITSAEEAELDDVYDDFYTAAYYIRLIRLCEKYYGEK